MQAAPFETKSALDDLDKIRAAPFRVSQVQCPILRSLRRAGLGGEAYLRDASPFVREQLRRDGIIVHDQPGQMTEAFRRCSVLIHRAGHGLTEIALAAAQAVARRFHQERSADPLKSVVNRREELLATA